MSIFNPVVMLVSLASLLIYGVGFFEYLVVSWLISAAIGWWSERKMIGYDHAIRQVAQRLDGRPRTGDNARLARMIRNLCKLLGPPTACVFPAIIMLFGIYYAMRTEAVIDGRAFRIRGSESTDTVEEEIESICRRRERDAGGVQFRRRACGYTYVY